MANGGKYSVNAIALTGLQDELKKQIKVSQGTHMFYGTYYTSTIVDVLERVFS